MVKADSMKDYYGSPANDEGVGGGTVVVRPRGGSHRPMTLTHHYRHSIDGFNWGYSGAGPSDLSRSLILDAFGVQECLAAPALCECVNPWADPSYTFFRDNVVAHLDQAQEFKLSQGTITDWVFDYIKGISTEPVAV